MATVLWDAQGIIRIDCLQKGQTITGEYCATLLSRSHEKLGMERPKLTCKKILFDQHNAPAHTSAVLMAKVHKIGFKLLPYPPYPPDLAPFGFFLFPNLKIWLGGKRFPSNEKVIAAADEYIKGFEISYLSEEIKKLEERWNKCAEVEGDCVGFFFFKLHKKRIFIYFASSLRKLCFRGKKNFEILVSEYSE